MPLTTRLGGQLHGWAVFKHLPMEAELTIGVMEKVIERSVARSRTRKRYCQVLERLGRFAGIECDFSHRSGESESQGYSY